MLRVVRSNRAEALLEPLVDVLRTPSVGPFGEETVAVGADGVRHWLEKQLAERLGVCARVRFPYVGALVQEALQAVVGAPSPDADPWRAETLPWAVLAVLPGQLGNDGFEPLRAYLGEADPGGIKPYQLACRIAGVFTRYLTFRPEMLRAWDVGSDATAHGDPWQPVLWRALRAHLAVPHPAEWTERFFAATEGSGGAPAGGEAEGPRRLCLFGISSLPRVHVRVLARLARRADVHLFAVDPSDEVWGRVRERRATWRALPLRADGGLDPAGLEVAGAHPLLTSLGTLGRDLHVLLERETDLEDAGDAAYRDPPGETLLARLQRDVRRSVPRGSEAAPPHALDPQDDSLTLHACHGEMRQVEVLQDQLLDLFRRDPTLHPSDVLVLTPDVETFAPLIDAVFSSREGAGPHLPVRVANRARRSESPVAEAMLRVLAQAGRRVTATRVIDLLDLEPVRRRFELTSDDVAQAAGWVRAAQVRWGVDAQDRARAGQPAFEENSWEWGLDRLLLGYAMPGRERDLFAGRLPFDEVEGGDAAVLGKLADFCQALFRHLRTLEERSRTLPEWGDALRALALDLTAVAEEDAPQLEALHAAIGRLGSEAEAARFTGAVTHEVPRALLQDHFDRSRTATGFLTGAITVCGMVPLRSVGFRVVGLLGLDDGAFPRSSAGAGFDLVARRPAVGDRSPREDDRYLFLEALLAARDHVRCLYSGQSVRDNAPQPPSVVLSELQDDLAQAYRLPPRPGETDEQARARVVAHLVVQHPLQPFSPRYFGLGGDARLFSYARGYVQGARALVSTPGPATPFWDGALPAPAGGDARTVALRDLERFFQVPAAALLRGRLGLAYPEAEEQASDREPLMLDGLQAHEVGRGLLDLALAGVTPGRAGAAALASGRLPPGTPGRCALADLAQQAGGLATAVATFRGGDRPREPLEVDLVLGGVRLVGQVPDLWPGGQVMHHFSSPKARYAVTLWIRHLALSAADPGTAWRSVVVNRAKTAPFFAAQALGPVEDARALLADLLALHVAGQRAPLVFFPETSLEYAEVYLKKIAGESTEAEARSAGRQAAGKAWSGAPSMGIDGERDDAFVTRVFGEQRPFDPGFSMPGLGVEPGHDFHALALRVGRPLLAHLTAVTA